MKATKNYFFSILAIMLLGVTFTHAQEAVQMGAVKDADGNAYNTLVIGKQTWMLENLRTTKYNDGTPVKNIKDGMEWIAAEEGAYASTNNTSDKAIIQKEGLLYNWYAVETGKLCPKGWYVPTEEEWNMLIAYASKTGTNVAKSLASKAGWIVNKAENAVGNDLSKNNASGLSLQDTEKNQPENLVLMEKLLFFGLKPKGVQKTLRRISYQTEVLHLIQEAIVKNQDLVFAVLNNNQIKI